MKTPRAPQLLIALSWISLAAWLLLTRGLHPGPAQPPGLSSGQARD